MKGTITDHRAHVELLIKGNGSQAKAEFVVDTGYTGTLALPLADCVALQLTRSGERDSYLADGSRIRLEIYLLTVDWDGNEREVEILAIGRERLLGAILLDGYKLCLDYSSKTLTIEEAWTKQL